MPRVKVIVDSVPNIGPGGATARRGDVVELDARAANVLVTIGKCAYETAQAEAPQPSPPPDDGYARRDMRAEETPKPKRARKTKAETATG